MIGRIFTKRHEYFVPLNRIVQKSLSEAVTATAERPEDIKGWSRNQV
jgi:hypothetical protein